MPTSTAIAAGELRHLVTIAQANTTEDKFGGADPSLAGATELATVYAKVEALTLRELYSAQQKVSEVTHRVTIRYLSGIKAGMLAWFRGRQFQIQAIENPGELNKLLVLLCLERDDSAREEGTSEPGSKLRARR
jgi:SPP1 family predicted phage head-tail adaptor